MKFIFKIVATSNSNSGTMPLRRSLFGVAAVLCVLLYGCAPSTTQMYIELTYHPQENVARFEEAGNIAIKVKVNDLRTEASNFRDKNEVAGPAPYLQIISENDLRELTTHAIETELINLGFKSGEKVLIEADLVKLYGYLKGDRTGTRVGYYSQLILHIDITNSERVLVFSKLIRSRGVSLNPAGKIAWSNVDFLDSAQISLETALKNGIFLLINDPEFITALIKANRN